MFAKLRCGWLSVLLFLLGLPAAPAFGGLAGTSASVAADAPRLLGLGVLEDTDGTQTVNAIAARPDSDFRQLPTGRFAGGYTRSVHWFRFTVDAPPGQWWLDVLPPFLDDVRLYEPDPVRAGAFLERRAGDALPMRQREIGYRGFAFLLHSAAPGPHVYHLRLQTSSSSMLFVRVFAFGDFLEQAVLDQGLLMAVLAVLFAVLVFNVIAWFQLRHPLLPWFAAYVLALLSTFAAAGGFQHQYLYPESGRLNDGVLAVSILLTMTFSSAFHCRLLKIGPDEPVLHAIYRLASVLPVLGMAPTALGHFTETMRLLSLVVLPMLLLSSILALRLWRRKEAGGAMTVLAKLIFSCGSFVMLLFMQGRISGNTWLLHTLEMATLANIFALQLAVLARVRAWMDRYRDAHERARHEQALRQVQGRFVDMIAHEYRTPLAVLQTNLDILALAPDPTQRTVVLARMRQALARLADLFRDAGKMSDLGELRQIDIQAVALEPLLQKGIAESDGAADGRHFRLEGGPMPPVAADPHLLDIIVRNLLENARKYSLPDSTILVSLRPVPVAGGDGVLLTLTNRCRPFAARIDDLLGKHWRGSNSHGQPGLGMGLHLVKKLAEDMACRFEIGLPEPDHFEARLYLPEAIVRECPGECPHE